MKKIILIPDSFKGTMSSVEVCKIMKTVVQRHYPKCNTVSIPIADGGEGTVECFLNAIEGTMVSAKARGPYLEHITAQYGIIENGKTAVIEMSSCAGLPMVEGNKNPLDTTTYGVGELITHAINNGCKKIILGLGGSCTNDGGTGMAAALGVKFYNSNGEEFIPTGRTLKFVNTITPITLKGIEIVAMCDVDNSLCGSKGAAYVFAPQKGANTKEVKHLDNGLRNLAKAIKISLGINNILSVKGGGAAGGMGAGVVAFLGGKLERGIDVLLNTTDFDAKLKDCDLVITGEGKIDDQSINGKVISGVVTQAKKQNIPVVAIAGDIDCDLAPFYQLGLTAALSTNRLAIPYTHAKPRCKQDLELTIETLMRLF